MTPERAFMPLGGRMTLEGGKSSAPPAPDYRGAAEQTAAGNKEALTQQTFANRPDQVTPWGTSQWTPTSTIDPSTGQAVTKWSQNQQVSPALQGALDQQLDLQGKRTDLASGQLDRVAADMSQPFDWQNLPGTGATPQTRNLAPTTTAFDPNAFAKQRDDYTAAAWEQMRPEHQRQEESVRTRLMNQGLTQGSEAYNNELARLQGQQGTERWNALNAGITQQKTLNDMMLASQGQAFGQQATASGQGFAQDKDSAAFQNLQRQQAIAEQAQRRGISLNEMNALLTGQQISPVNMPSFSPAGQGQGANLLAAAQGQGQYDMSKYQADQALQGQTNAGLGTLAGLAAYAAISDRRLKRHIRRIGKLASGIPVYLFKYRGSNENHIGVMADEVLPVIPSAVIQRIDGYYMVMYSKLR